MPEVRVADRRWTVPAGSNLLDALNAQGCHVPHGCRAGSCHACVVQCLTGAPADARPDALPARQYAEGWRLACQCQVVEDLEVLVFDPLLDCLPSRVAACDWLSPRVLRLRLRPQRPLRYQAGQHLLLWTAHGVARPYSLASLPGEDDSLEFHLECGQPGAFADGARQLQPGDRVGLGELRGGALHYDPDWHARPLWLLAAGTGLAPLWGVLREALRQRHQGPIRVVHVAAMASEHYLAGPLQALAAQGVQVDLVTAEDFSALLANLRPASRQTIALLCGSPTRVEAFSKRLFLAGLPRGQVLVEAFAGV